MYKKNTAIVGFGIGHFINASTGVVVTVGIPTCKRTLDGVGDACINAASYNTDGAVWEIDLDASDMNGDNIILSFSLTDCLPISYALQTTTVTLAEIETAITNLIAALVPVTSLPLPAISIDTIKTILRLTDSEYDDQLTVLIPIIENIVVNYCGVSAISDLSVGAIFPIAGLVRYAMENPIGAKSQTVGSDRTEYGEFPNALLKLLDNFKPDTVGGYTNAEVINLQDVNVELGI